MYIRLVLNLNPQLAHVNETKTGSMPLESLSLDVLLARRAILQ